MDNDAAISLTCGDDDHKEFMQQWLDANEATSADFAGTCAGERGIDREEGFASRFYSTCLREFQQLCRQEQKGYAHGSRSYLLKEELDKLYMWGESFGPGELDNALDESEELRDNVLDLLVNLGELVICELRASSTVARAGQIHELESFIKQARLIMSDGDGQVDLDALASDATCLIRDEYSDDYVHDFCEDVVFIIKCLTELGPSLEQNLASAGRSDPSISKSAFVLFCLSGPAGFYVSLVRDKFKQASKELVERLGEANWQRHLKVRNMMGDPENNPAKGQETARSVFQPDMTFHDSGIGTSVPAQTQYAPSHTSFRTSNTEGGLRSLRVPPTPLEATDGKSFRCYLCGDMLSTVRTRTQWKMHVFSDLMPYICTFDGCQHKLSCFPSRSAWANHEFQEHRFDEHWACPECSRKSCSALDWEHHLNSVHNQKFSGPNLVSARNTACRISPKRTEEEECPLCRVVLGKPRRAFVKHVSRHMEDIALMALPSNAEEDSEKGSISTNLDSNEDHDTSKDLHIDEEYTIKCICGFEDDDGNTVYCEQCDTWQHTQCYYLDENGIVPTKDVLSSVDHFCAECKPRSLGIRAAIERQKNRRAQIGPDSLLMQPDEEKSNAPPEKLKARTMSGLPEFEEKEEVKEEVIEYKEEARFPRRGKTKMPARLVSKRAIIELGYPFEEDGEVVIVLKALSKEQIDEVVRVSKEMNRGASESRSVPSPYDTSGVPAEPPSFQYRRNSSGHLVQVPYVPPSLRGPAPPIQHPIRSPSVRSPPVLERPAQGDGSIRKSPQVERNLVNAQPSPSPDYLPPPERCPTPVCMSGLKRISPNPPPHDEPAFADNEASDNDVLTIDMGDAPASGPNRNTARPWRNVLAGLNEGRRERRRPSKVQAFQGDAVLIPDMGGLNDFDIASKAGEEPLPEESDESTDEDELKWAHDSNSTELLHTAWGESWISPKDHQYGPLSNEITEAPHLETRNPVDPFIKHAKIPIDGNPDEDELKWAHNSNSTELLGTAWQYSPLNNKITEAPHLKTRNPMDPFIKHAKIPIDGNPDEDELKWAHNSNSTELLGTAWQYSPLNNKITEAPHLETRNPADTFVRHARMPVDGNLQVLRPQEPVKKTKRSRRRLTLSEREQISARTKRSRRCLTLSEREQISARRKSGVCSDCRKAKRRCTHLVLDLSRSSVGPTEPLPSPNLSTGSVDNPLPPGTQTTESTLELLNRHNRAVNKFQDMSSKSINDPNNQPPVPLSQSVDTEPPSKGK